ncbi:hypothetical protein BC831DRAFT_385623, partial [Entophlyctis helioformis]
AKAVKAMRLLQRFMFRNQEYRFTDKDKARLFGAVEAYFTLLHRSSGTGRSAGTGESALPLIEDALKVPFFTAKQKTAMLRWHEELLGPGSGAGSGTGAGARSQHANDNDDGDDSNEW